MSTISERDKPESGVHCQHSRWTASRFIFILWIFFRVIEVTLMYERKKVYNSKQLATTKSPPTAVRSAQFHLARDRTQQHSWLESGRCRRRRRSIFDLHPGIRSIPSGVIIVARRGEAAVGDDGERCISSPSVHTPQRAARNAYRGYRDNNPAHRTMFAWIFTRNSSAYK